ncbi:MAG TPA: SCO2522 family protein [Pseudonocardiaceae bacterium]|nr:SCO2522 family protein [Pseudonocardiaceae bacterium]
MAERVSEPAATFHELTAEPRVEQIPLAHLSIELGHLYMEDFAAGPARLADQFARVAPWAAAANSSVVPQRVRSAGRTPRVSTCFLIDDYFTQFSSPAEVLPQLQAAASAHGLEIDYLARESACAEADGVPLARLVATRLTAMPAPETNGSRPTVLESGWLCNGQRSPHEQGHEAMGRRGGWAPPAEIGARNHSVFLDVELWHDKGGRRVYSCAFLAAVWQLLRLGMLRHEGANVVHPKTLTDGFPDRWEELPPVVKLRENAAPFCAYHSLSLLPGRFLATEHAVRVILDQIAPQPELLDQLVERSERDGLTVSPDLTDRVDYVLFNGF